MGLFQTGGYLGLLALTGSAAYFSAGRLPWPMVVLITLFHGACYNFLINGFHELVHDSVFKTRALNRWFLWVFSFLGWYNHIHFWASHTAHHKYTLHPPDDGEVVLPVRLTLRGFLFSTILNFPGLYYTLRSTVRRSLGRLEGEWEIQLFTNAHPELRRKLVNWSRFLLAGHASIVIISLSRGLWLLPVVVSLAPFYGGALHYLCNSSQHVGLRNNVPDFRLCCRTIILNPFVQFLYWHMNYHIEHHMYARVPCYKLGKLHRLIRHELPASPRGLLQTWKQIITILKRQRVEPDYQYSAVLPEISSAALLHSASKTVSPTL
jgi:fatty acid desaturase